MYDHNDTHFNRNYFRCSNGDNQNPSRFMMFMKWKTIMGLNYCADSGYAENLQFHNCHYGGGSQVGLKIT